MVGDPSRAGGDEPSVPTSTRRVLLGELLVESKVITKEQLTEVLASPREGKKLGQVLLEKGWVTEQQLTQTLSLQLSVPWVSLYHIDFSRQLLNRVSRELAESYCLIPIFVRHVRGQGETLYVAMDDPTNESALQEVSRLANLPAKPMIASQSDIRSAIRVYYGEAGGSTSIDVPAPPTKTLVEPAVTVREPKPAPPATPTPKPKPEKPKTLPNQDAAPNTPAAATIPDPQPRSVPPPAPPSLRKPPSGVDEAPPMTTRSEPPAALREQREKEIELPLPRRHIARSDDSEGTAKRRGPKMVALTLLDGTTITLPAKKKKEGPIADALTARDIVSALRATAHGADASEILGDQVRWEPIVAALHSILLRKGLIADWEFVEELRKI